MLFYGVSTVTYAQMGVSVLNRSGFRASVERNRASRDGCGFILAVNTKNAAAVERALARGGVPVKRL